MLKLPYITTLITVSIIYEFKFFKKRNLYPDCQILTHKFSKNINPFLKELAKIQIFKIP